MEMLCQALKDPKSKLQELWWAAVKFHIPTAAFGDLTEERYRWRNAHQIEPQLLWYQKQLVPVVTQKI